VTVYTPAYCSREDAQQSIDFPDGITTTIQRKSDRAIQSTARNIEGELHRLFYPWDGTKWWDYPNYQGAYPWKLWLDRNDLLCLTSFSSGGAAIPLDNCFLRPANKRPGYPYTSIELDRSGSSTFGGNSSTPQNAIMTAGTWGFTADADPAGELAAAVTSAGQATITVTDASQMGVGDLLILGYGRGEPPFPDDALGHAGLIAPYIGERVLVSDRSALDLNLAQEGDGCSTAVASDNVLEWSGAGGEPPCPGEVLLLDAEQVLVLSVTGSAALVERGWNGTVLGTHEDAGIYAYRVLSVQRGFLGTAATTWPEATPVSKHRVPSLIRDLSIAESANRILQETGGYSRNTGSGDAAMPAPGVALADLWDECRTAYGRQARSRVI
jgi:hypothetical protein